MRPTIVTLAALAGALGLALLGAPPAHAAHGYDHSVVGNPDDVTAPTSGLVVLQGGGTDIDENFVRMGARMGGGDFVVIRASGADGPGGTFDLDKWRGTGGISYTLSAESGVLTSSRGEVY